MTTATMGPHQPDSGIKRRGLLAATAALIAAVVGKVTEQRVQAADGDPVLIGAINSGTGRTYIASSVAGTGTAVLEVQASSTATAHAVFAHTDGTSGTGVQAEAFSLSGVTFGLYASSHSPNGTGARGGNNSLTGPTVGVRGDVSSPDGFAVYGINGRGGTAILGEVPSFTNQNGIGLYGLNNSSYPGPGPGAGGFGVYGLSAKGHGLVGATSAAGAAAVVGATNGVAGAYAAAFYGPVVVSGNFTVVGGAKSAAVPHPDGSHRRLYCVESPESWFEDFGRGQLEAGCATVTIDADFAAVANLDDYHVFVTPLGTHDGLSVMAQTSSGFSVESSDPTSTTRFSWRVVAKRKDIPAPRFETVTIPPEPTLPAIPEPVRLPSMSRQPSVA